MKKDLYNNNEEEFQHVIKLLKELPKENAPENFEYNLKVKIENKNFELNTKEDSIFSRWNVFVPALGAVAASIIIFFTVFSNSDSIENPFQVEPQLRNTLNGSSIHSNNFLSNLNENEKINENDVVLKEETKETIENNFTENVKNNEVLAKSEKPSFPFENYESTNLDEALNKGKSNTSIDRRAQLASRSNSNFFNGFYIREEVDKEYVEALKARMDSLKRAYKMQFKKLQNVE